MSDFRNYLNEQLQRPSFKAEWDALQPELTIAQAMIDARKESGLTQKQLSERTGIAQADISKLERGNANNQGSTPTQCKYQLASFQEYQQPCIGNQCHGGMQVAAPQPERLR